MKPKGLTASALWRAAACPASVVLPAVEKQYRDSKRGREEHAKLRAATPPGSLGEAAFTYNVLSGEARFLGQDLERDYGDLAEGEIPGTTDVLHVRDDHLLMQDYKTAFGYAEKMAGTYDKPGDSLQFGHNALAAASYHRKSRVLFEVLYTKTGEVKDAEFDALDFAAIHERLLSIWSRVRAAEAALALDGDLISAGLIAEGSHCWRCPAEAACPLKHPKRRTA